MFWVLGGFFCFFSLFVCISQASQEEEKEEGKLNWLVSGNMGGISFNFISYNFNLLLPELF